MMRAVETKKDDLKRKKPGSIIPSEPKFLWVKMLNRVNGRSEFLALRWKFNDVLDEICSQREQHYDIDIVDIMADPAYYDANNFIYNDCLKRFWTEIDRMIEKFNMKRISLKPELAKKNFFPKRFDRKWKQAKGETTYKMPPPPPVYRDQQQRDQQRDQHRNQHHDQQREDKCRSDIRRRNRP